MPWDDEKVVPKTNQDRGYLGCSSAAHSVYCSCFVYPFGEQPGEEQAMFGVFDGHGEEGHWVAEFVMSEMPRVLANELQSCHGVEEAMQRVRIYIYSGCMYPAHSGIDTYGPGLQTSGEAPEAEPRY